MRFIIFLNKFHPTHGRRHYVNLQSYPCPPTHLLPLIPPNTHASSLYFTRQAHTYRTYFLGAFFSLLSTHFHRSRHKHTPHHHLDLYSLAHKQTQRSFVACFLSSLLPSWSPQFIPLPNDSPYLAHHALQQSSTETYIITPHSHRPGH